MGKKSSENRKLFNQKTLNSDKRKYYSAVSLSQFKITLPLIKDNIRGKFIDVGCGDLYYKQYIMNYVDMYESIDFKKNADSITYIGDIQNMEMIESLKYDSAICLEVLEHVPDPFKALREINRILKQDGILIISVPHLSRLHEIPYDFYRYTRYGLEFILKECGFKIIDIRERGGIFSFISHQFSTVLITVTLKLPILNIIIYALNKYFIVIPTYYLDKLFNLGKRLPVGYTVLVKKI